MSAWWAAPLALAVLTSVWLVVQRLWVACMALDAHTDALERSGPCGCDCVRPCRPGEASLAVEPEEVDRR